MLRVCMDIREEENVEDVGKNNREKKQVCICMGIRVYTYVEHIVRFPKKRESKQTTTWYANRLL